MVHGCVGRRRAEAKHCRTRPEQNKEDPLKATPSPRTRLLLLLLGTCLKNIQKTHPISVMRLQAPNLRDVTTREIASMLPCPVIGPSRSIRVTPHKPSLADCASLQTKPCNLSHRTCPIADVSASLPALLISPSSTKRTASSLELDNEPSLPSPPGLLRHAARRVHQPVAAGTIVLARARRPPRAAMSFAGRAARPHAHARRALRCRAGT